MVEVSITLSSPAVDAALRRPSILRIGAVVWLASELMFFSGLFAAYFALRAANKVWPPSEVEFEVGRTALFTAVLVASSFTMHAAVRAAEHRRLAPAVRWTVLTAAMGALFLANQGMEYAGLGFTHTTDAYGSIFFLMTGFHGLHVLGGIVLMLAVLGVAAPRTSRAPLVDSLTVTEFYWHFVDVVWVVMFATIYLLR